MKSLGKRRRAREMAMQMLYQFDMGAGDAVSGADSITPQQDFLEQIFAGFDLEGYRNDDGGLPSAEGSVPENYSLEPSTPLPEAPQDRRLVANAFEYARRLVRGTLEHGSTIDQRIRTHAENWRLERMPTIDRNILRLAIYEMLHETSVPKVVIVDEAIELAKKFGSENSGRFVNGLLDGILQSEAKNAASQVVTDQVVTGKVVAGKTVTG